MQLMQKRDVYKRQVTDYALDLNSFHKESHNKLLVPILVSTEAAEEWQEIKEIRKNILETHCCNELNIHNYIQEIVENYNKNEFNPIEWVNSIYMPTPTIIPVSYTHLWREEKLSIEIT